MDKGESVTAVYITLFLVSLLYNRLVGWMEKEGFLNGYMALLAMGGCGYTIMGLALILPPETTLLIAGAFISALAPMIGGDLYRYFKARIDWREFWSRLTNKKDADDQE